MSTNYSQTTNLLNGIRRHFRAEMFPWDEYFATMASLDYLAGCSETIATKTHFIRREPFGGSYVLLGGITAALSVIDDFRFDYPGFEEIMLDLGHPKEFVSWLVKEKGLRVQVFAAKEGSLFIRNDPIIVFRGPLPHMRLVEGIITKEVNFPTLSLTKWRRLVEAAGDIPVYDFSRRRAQDPDRAALYAILAGCAGSSNTAMREHFEIPVIGTWGHEAIQSYGDPKTAFDLMLEHRPDKPVGLVDTIQCLEVDFPAWLDAVWKHREKIINADSPVWGWRNDSGDLAYLTLVQFERYYKHPLSEIDWFNDRLRVFLTNDLDEYVINSIVGQINNHMWKHGIRADRALNHLAFAAGTKPGTCADESSLQGVSKLTSIGDFASIKLSFDAEGLPGPKTSIPGNNRSAWIIDRNDRVVTTLIYPADGYRLSSDKLVDRKTGKKLDTIKAIHPDDSSSYKDIRDYKAIQKQRLVYDSLTGMGFTESWENPTLSSVTEYIGSQLEMVDWSSHRITKPHVLKVSLTPDLFELRKEMIRQRVLREDLLE